MLFTTSLLPPGHPSVLLYFYIFVFLNFLAKDPNCYNCFLQPGQWSPFTAGKKGRISGGALSSKFVVGEFYFLENCPWMRPLLRCHLEIPKNCQISHGASFNRNLNRHLVEDRIPVQADRRSWERVSAWHCHLIGRTPPLSPSPLSFSSSSYLSRDWPQYSQSSPCHLIIRVRRGSRPWGKLSLKVRQTFCQQQTEAFFRVLFCFFRGVG